MTDTPAATAPAAPQQVTLQDHVNNHKTAVIAKANELVGLTNGVIDSWVNNFVLTDKIKNRRTEQVNYILGFVNQLANEGLPPLTELGNTVKDPEISNKALECNNLLMTAARNLLNTVQQQEAEFQKELQALAPPQAQGPKTEVKAQEA
jgi:hypothetical protein